VKNNYVIDTNVFFETKDWLKKFNNSRLFISIKSISELQKFIKSEQALEDNEQYKLKIAKANYIDLTNKLIAAKSILHGGEKQRYCPLKLQLYPVCWLDNDNEIFFVYKEKCSNSSKIIENMELGIQTVFEQIKSDLASEFATVKEPVSIYMGRNSEENLAYIEDKKTKENSFKKVICNKLFESDDLAKIIDKLDIFCNKIYEEGGEIISTAMTNSSLKTQIIVTYSKIKDA
jgi:hypothetical protein